MKYDVRIKGVKCTEIDWCIDPSDIGCDEFDEAAVEAVEDTLPKEEYYPLPHISDDSEYVQGFVISLADKMSDEYGYLVNSFNYHFVYAD